MIDREQLFWLFFRLNGRISRLVYLLAGLLLNMPIAFLLYRYLLAPEGSDAVDGWRTALVIGSYAAVWPTIALSVKRLHDFDKPGIFAVALFIPVVTFVAFAAFLFVPGNPGPNRYAVATNEPR